MSLVVVNRLEEFGTEPSTTSLSEDRLSLFQRRYDNGYNLYENSMYIAWLQQEHPDHLPGGMELNGSKGEVNELIET